MPSNIHVLVEIIITPSNIHVLVEIITTPSNIHVLIEIIITSSNIHVLIEIIIMTSNIHVFRPKPERQRIVMLSQAHNFQEPLVTFEGKVSSLTTDWIGQRLYWLEERTARESENDVISYVIMTYDLVRKRKPSEILTRQSVLGQLQSDPFHR